ncbi:MAG: HpcH/HpaI aldolase family protein [Dehalococcoidia bacterium]|jgi:2-keto-3-deoxy-L-rhamnonate aldolase RhmA
MVDIRQNKVKKALSTGKTVTIPMGPFSSDIIEYFGHLEYPGIWLEGEHGPVDFNNIPDLTRACDLWGMTSIVRVHQNEPGVIYRTLDLGAMTITVPHVNTKEEAQNVIDASKFHPIGMRGSSTGRQGIGVDNYLDKANDQSMVIILIEDIIAVNNLDEILEVDHIDVFYVAPGDLAQSMGLLGGAGSPEVTKIVEESIKKITSKGKIAGTIVSEKNIAHFNSVGAQFLSFPWTPWLSEGAKRMEKAIKSIS